MREFGKNLREYEKIRESPEEIRKDTKESEKIPEFERKRENPEEYEKYPKQYERIRPNLRRYERIWKNTKNM
mgnify:CR=1 FL=1